jgi:purine-nucleoside phosphorylase
MSEMKRINEAADVLKKKFRQKPAIAIVLGSGLGDFTKVLADAVSVPFEGIPHFPRPTVEGHGGELVCGTLNDVAILAQKGRLHYYEGNELLDVVLPVRVMAALGIRTLVMTNAAGGVNPTFRPGDIMVIRDQINLTGLNPLRGANLKELGPRFVDMSSVYDTRLIDIMHSTAREQGLSLHEGIYQWFPGPTYETPADIRAARLLGADAVGMSTVPEVIAASHAGMKVAGLSCITNLGAGMVAQRLTHEDVVAVAQSAVGKMHKLLQAALPRMENKK